MFKNIIALNTYTQPFLSTKQAEQREIIEQLLGITLLSQKADLLKEKMKATKTEGKKTKFKNIYISPNVGDAGGAIGSALVSSSLLEKKFINKKMINPFLGPEFSNEYIKENIINSFKLSFF